VPSEIGYPEFGVESTSKPRLTHRSDGRSASAEANSVIPGTERELQVCQRAMNRVYGLLFGGHQ
jgi:hypothetical protein